MVNIPSNVGQRTTAQEATNTGASLQMMVNALQTNTQLLGQIYQAINTKFPNWVAVPATAASAGTAGQVAYDATHFYVCVASNTWVRVLLATF